MKTIKMVGTKVFTLSLNETINGEYVIECETEHSNASSLPIQDLNTAKAIFETKLIELEGH